MASNRPNPQTLPRRVYNFRVVKPMFSSSSHGVPRGMVSGAGGGDFQGKARMGLGSGRIGAVAASFGGGFASAVGAGGARGGFVAPSFGGGFPYAVGAGGTRGGVVAASFGGGFSSAGGAGGAGGGGAGFRTAASSLADGGFQSFAPNEKLELQTLNDRLAAYLDKVKKLELANHELEEKLRGFTANKVQVTYDFQAFQCQLQPLRDQIADFLKEISRLTLSIDNAGLAADDYRVKFENEATVRQTVEAEIAALKALKRDHELTTATLTQEYEILQKDRDVLQTTHKQEVQTLRGQMAGTLTVDVQAENSVDLSRRLSELRSEYENIVAKNRGEIEAWYSSSLEARVKETAEITEVTVSGSAEITSSRSEILTLQTDLDALLLQKSQLEQRLVEVQGQKQTQLLTLSRLAANLEGELASVRENALQQAHDYQLLLSTKVQLEKEITSYKSLLEFSEDLSKFPGVSSSLSPSLVGKSAFTKVSLSGSISGEGGASAGGASAGGDLLEFSLGASVSSESDATNKETAVST